MKKLAYDITRTRRNLKKANFSKKLNEAGENTRQAWNVIRDFIGKPRKATIHNKVFKHNDDCLTKDNDAFCHFYSSIVQHWI